MLKCDRFINCLIDNKISFFTGVPDSILKHFCTYLDDNFSSTDHIISANEGGAIAIAAGHYLATGNPGLVYLQNSGLGNTINPLVSLADKRVYGIPILLMIGWRGAPGVKDEPQHISQGNITREILDLLNIPYEILPDNFDAAKDLINKAVLSMNDTDVPFALLCKKNTFEEYSGKNKINKYVMSRESALKIIIETLSDDNIFVSTTGMLSRELFELRKKLNQNIKNDFLNVGAMGHVSQIALGIAAGNKEKNVICLDGDGSLIMHMGALAIIGNSSVENLKHIMLNNGVHSSVGGQNTAGFGVDFCIAAKSCGYVSAYSADAPSKLRAELKTFAGSTGPSFLEIKINNDFRNDVSRPDLSPKERKNLFMKVFKNSN